MERTNRAQIAHNLTQSDSSYVHSTLCFYRKCSFLYAMHSLNQNPKSVLSTKPNRKIEAAAELMSSLEGFHSNKISFSRPSWFLIEWWLQTTHTSMQHISRFQHFAAVFRNMKNKWKNKRRKNVNIFTLLSARKSQINHLHIYRPCTFLFLLRFASSTAFRIKD